MDKFQKVKDLVDSLQKDAEKFYDGGNGAAGTRVRKERKIIYTIVCEQRELPWIDPGSFFCN
jgi:hypothetical protein